MCFLADHTSGVLLLFSWICLCFDVLWSLPSRPPDRRRRDVFGAANSSHLRYSSAVPPLQADANSSSGAEPLDRDFDFSEQSVTERELQISGLKPFTVYRIDIHACNRQVQRCSAAEFVFSRTKPAGEQV